MFHNSLKHLLGGSLYSHMLYSKIAVLYFFFFFGTGIKSCIGRQLLLVGTVCQDTKCILMTFLNKTIKIISIENNFGEKNPLLVEQSSVLKQRLLLYCHLTITK